MSLMMEVMAMVHSIEAFHLGFSFFFFSAESLSRPMPPLISTLFNVCFVRFVVSFPVSLWCCSHRCKQVLI